MYLPDILFHNGRMIKVWWNINKHNLQNSVLNIPRAMKSLQKAPLTGSLPESGNRSVRC